jgi:tetratricopeptide (TPR) repeat protein
MILYRPSTKKTYYLNPRGFPIGIQLHEKELFRKSIESDTIQLAEDDILLLYTDGITEAMNARRDLFGEERLLKCIREYGNLRVVPFVDKLKEEILSFTEGNVQYDDITAVAVREKTSPEKEELRRAKQAHLMIASGQSIREACESVGITTYTYYNKYKKEFEEKGIDNFSIDSEVSVDLKHIAIEDKTKIFDIIKNHPEYGPKRVSEELNTEKYGFTVISENQIYEEFVRSRLNTRQLREAFVARGGRSRRPIKPPGTPLLTLDGKIIMDRGKSFEQKPEPAEEAAHEMPPPPRPAPQKLLEPPKPPAPSRRRSGVDLTGVEIDANTLFAPIEDLLDRSRTEPSDLAKTPEDDKRRSRIDEEESAAAEAAEQTPDVERSEDAGVIADASELIGASFEELYAGETAVEENGAAADELETANDGNTPAPPPAVLLNIKQIELPPTDFRSKLPPAGGEDDNEKTAEEELAFSAVDDLLQQEIENSFMDGADIDTTEEIAALDADDKRQQAFSNETANVEAQDGLEEGFADAGSSTGQELSVDYVDNENNRQQEAAAVLADANSRDGVAQNGAQRPASEVEALRRPAADGRDSPPHDAARPVAPADRPKRAPDVELHTEQARQEERERLLINGLRHYKGQRFQEAIDEFKKAISLYPDFKEAHSILGNAYFRNHMYAEAAQAYDRVKQMDPYDTTAYENMGVIYANRGDFREAVREWEQLLEIDPKRDDIRKKIDKAMRLMHSAAVS